MATQPNRFWPNDSGAIAATYAVALLGLIAIAGVGYDYARMAGLDSELQNAADQSALAAATQLNKETGACQRASNAAVSMLRNLTMLSNDGNGSGNRITFTGETACDGTGFIRFYQDKAKSQAATSDANARFVEVRVNPRAAMYALTPVVGALRSSGQLQAAAFAGVGSAICRVPPLMICSPSENPAVPFDAANKVGMGIKATGGSSWTPGAFGFLEIGSGRTAELAEALAFDEGRFDCQKIDEGTNPETGNAQVLFDAVNTRFDVGFSGGGTLSPCNSGACPPAVNVTKDLIKTSTATGGNSCRIHNSGWKLPTKRFSPRNWLASDTSSNTFNASGTPDAIGLTRDMCHYNSYGRNCTSQNGGISDRFGSKTWAIRDYFAKNHPGTLPPSDSMSRYAVYRWEIDNNNFPGTTGGQRSRPLCIPGVSNIDRRVLTVAIVKNCAELRGGSRAVKIDEWVDMFLVEPVVDDSTERANGRDRDMIYMEVIGPARLGGGAGSTTTQAIRRDVPYLIE